MDGLCFRFRKNYSMSSYQYSQSGTYRSSLFCVAQLNRSQAMGGYLLLSPDEGEDFYSYLYE